MEAAGEDTSNEQAIFIRAVDRVGSNWQNVSVASGNVGSEMQAKYKTLYHDDAWKSVFNALATKEEGATQGVGGGEGTELACKEIDDFENYLGVLNMQYKSLGESNPEAHKNTWSIRPEKLNEYFDDFYDKETEEGTFSVSREKGALLTNVAYKAIDKFENTHGTAQGTSMNKGDGYSKTQEKEIKAYVEKNIGMDAWDKMSPKMQMQVYSFAFNNGTKYTRDIRDGNGTEILHYKGDEKLSTIQGLAQALAPDKIKTDDARRKLTAAEAKKIIRKALLGE